MPNLQMRKLRPREVNDLLKDTQLQVGKLGISTQVWLLTARETPPMGTPPALLSSAESRASPHRQVSLSEPPHHVSRMCCHAAPGREKPSAAPSVPNKINRDGFKPLGKKPQIQE